jgi:hypothetical protein
MPDIDLFASRINFQVKPYIAYKPDPEAYAINAFHTSWKDFKFYAFPPFSIIQKVLQKINEEKATGFLVVPHWPTQTWWPYLMHMLIDLPLILPREKQTLYLPADPQRVQPLLPGDSSFGNHSLVTRFVKGVCVSRPSLPRYRHMGYFCCFGLHKNIGLYRGPRSQRHYTQNCYVNYTVIWPKMSDSSCVDH